MFEYVLKNLGLKKALVFCGSDGLDEITLTGKTFVSEYDGQEIKSYDISPDEFGLKISELKDIEGGDLNDNVKIFQDILQGASGPKRDIVLLNAAYAFYITGRVKDIMDVIDLAREVIDSGKAMKKLEELKNFTNSKLS